MCVCRGGETHHENLTSLYVIMVVAWTGFCHNTNNNDD